MSVYRVIRNYYYDLLNFLRDKDRTKGGITNYIDNIPEDDKIIIIGKISEMMFRFDIAFNNEVLYWNNIKKEQSWYAFLYIVMIAFAFLGIGYLFILNFKEIKSRGGDMSMVLKSLLTYIIIFQVVMSVFIVFLINISYTKKLCDGQIKLLTDDAKAYSNFLFTGVYRGDYYEWYSRFFTFFGYWKRNNMVMCRQILPNLKSFNPNDILSLFPVDALPKKDELFGWQPSEDSKNPSTDKSTSLQVDIQVYNKLKDSLSSSLKNLYNSGKGYINIKKILLMSSPILMLVETKRIMKYYEFVSSKKTLTEISEKEQKKERELIKVIVIDKLINLLGSVNSAKDNSDDAAISREIVLNEKNRNFVIEMECLIFAFAYMAIFCYPIYIKTSDKASNFPAQLSASMPTLINTGDLPKGRLRDYLEYLKANFSLVYREDFEKELSRSVSIDNPMAPMKSLCTKLIPVFKKTFDSIFEDLQGSVYFPFNKKYITGKISYFMNDKTRTGAHHLPFEYRQIMTDFMYDEIVVPIADNYDILSVKKNAVIDECVRDLMPYDKINVLKYQNYIINSLIEFNKDSQDQANDIIEVLNQLQKNLMIQRQINYADKIKVDKNAFMEPDEFIEFIGNIEFRQFKNGLNIAYMQEIMDKFYLSISESVNLRSANLRNIYYNKQRKFALWKAIIGLFITFQVLLLIRIAISVIDSKKYIKKIQVERDCDNLYAEKDLSNKNINWLVQLILPTTIGIFVIAILIAFYKKMQQTFDFNLEIVENNTNDLKNTLEEFSRLMEECESRLDDFDKDTKISKLDKITEEDKKKFLEFIKKAIDKFEKCNYVLESAKVQFPFPYTDVIINGFMLVMSSGALLYILGSFAPLKRVRDIRFLNKLKEELAVTDDLQGFINKLSSLAVCHYEEMDGIIISFKIMFFSALVLFLLFYSGKIISTSNDFKIGLFNSMYYEESQCYED